MSNLVIPFKITREKFIEEIDKSKKYYVGCIYGGSVAGTIKILDQSYEEEFIRTSDYKFTSYQFKESTLDLETENGTRSKLICGRNTFYKYQNYIIHHNTYKSKHTVHVYL